MKATRRATALALLAALCGGAALVAPRSALRRSAARTRAAPRLAAAPLADILEQPTAAGGARAQRFVLVGGKGGVGKTSTASALAVRCAESGLRTLVASTDPAHSLGDALQLSLAGGAPVRVPGLETLDALEIDPTEAIGKFRAALAAFRPSDLGLGGMAEQLVGQLGLEDFADILDEPPPGLDELLALSEVVDLATGARARREAGGGAGLRAGAGQAKEIELDDFDARLRARGDAGATTVASRGDAGAGALSEGSETFPYDRIILDTAPTGHTLRLLALPTFLESLLSKIGALRSRLGGALAAAAALGLVGNGIEAKLERAAGELEALRQKVAGLKALLADGAACEFVVVTVPTDVALAETERLLAALAEQRVRVRHLVVNQMVLPDVAPAYLGRLRKGQDAVVRRLLGRDSAAAAGAAGAVLTGAAGSEWAGIGVSPVAYYDLELRGVYPLRFLADKAFSAPEWAPLVGAPPAGGAAGGGALTGAGRCQFVVMGGKGGVGKTSTSAALALRCADAGLRTLIVSTDPAHSLGDVLQVSLAGKAEPTVVEEASHRRLFALEVDPEEAARKFQTLIRQLGTEANAAKAAGGSARGGGGGGGTMLDQLADQLGLADFAEVLDTLPPGADELVALATVVSLLEKGAMGEPFERVIIDTAPTGHTLRLLRFPDFLDRFVTRLLALRDKLSGAGALLGTAAAAMRTVFGGGGGRAAPPPPAAAADGAALGLTAFRLQMRELSAILHDPLRAQFCIVAIPTELALLESTRLLLALRADGVAVRHLVLNRIVNADGDGGAQFVARLAAAHGKAAARAAALGEATGVDLTTVPYFDTEVVGLPGLRALGASLFRSV